MLTAQNVRLVYVYDPETGIFTRGPEHPNHTRRGKPVGSMSRHGYIVFRYQWQLYRAHRVAWLYMTGEWPSGNLDHINGVKHDNRWANLRPIDKSKNAINAPLRMDNKSGVKGVYLRRDTKKWTAEIKLEGRKYCLGSFATMEEAIDARKRASEKIHGEFARV